MATFTKRKLESSTNGLSILVVGTTTADASTAGGRGEWYRFDGGFGRNFGPSVGRTSNGGFQF